MKPCNKKNQPQMKQLYDHLVKALPMMHTICPATLKSRKSNSTNRVLKESEKQRNVFKQLKRPKKKSSQGLRMPNSPAKKKIERKLSKHYFCPNKRVVI